MKSADPAAALLRRACRGRSRGELKALFALIRAKTDRALFVALKPVKAAPKRKADPLVRDLEQAFRPMLGSAAEKAELLVEHMARAHKRNFAYAPRGLADAARRLRADFSDAKIRSGAKALVAELAVLYSKRETVV